MSTRDCEVRGRICSNELVAQYTFKKKRGDKEDPPVFWCCGPCKVFTLRLHKPIPYTAPD